MTEIRQLYAFITNYVEIKKQPVVPDGFLMQTYLFAYVQCGVFI